jgi:hypothetical protein
MRNICYNQKVEKGLIAAFFLWRKNGNLGKIRDFSVSARQRILLDRGNKPVLVSSPSPKFLGLTF